MIYKADPRLLTPRPWLDADCGGARLHLARQAAGIGAAAGRHIEPANELRISQRWPPDGYGYDHPRFIAGVAAEIEKRGDYVKTVVLNSPGGSVADALAIGRLIRKRNFATRVEAGRYCASACPLVFAEGVERRVEPKAVIGVHQIAAVKSAAGGPSPDEMSLAQRASAQCLAYLVEMGVNPRVWVHAMETPHDRLFVFPPDELAAMKLMTADPPPPSPAAIQPQSRS